MLSFLIKKGIIAGLIIACWASPALACEYYAWVNYGPAEKEGKVASTEKVYQDSGVIELEHGFKAVYSEVGETRHVTGFQIENLGPFENSAVAGKALSDFIDELEAEGYELKTPRHTLPEVVERDKVLCE